MTQTNEALVDSLMDKLTAISTPSAKTEEGFREWDVSIEYNGKYNPIFSLSTGDLIRIYTGTSNSTVERVIRDVILIKLLRNEGSDASPFSHQTEHYLKTFMAMGAHIDADGVCRYGTLRVSKKKN